MSGHTGGEGGGGVGEMTQNITQGEGGLKSAEIVSLIILMASKYSNLKVSRPICLMFRKVFLIFVINLNYVQF